jgi:hypothetical protein
MTYGVRTGTDRRGRPVYRVVRSDGKEIALTADRWHAADIEAKFNAWAAQGWPYKAESNK